MFENREIVLALFYIMKETKVLLLLNYSDMLLPLVLERVRWVEALSSLGGIICGGRLLVVELFVVVIRNLKNLAGGTGINVRYISLAIGWVSYLPEELRPEWSSSGVSCSDGAQNLTMSRYPLGHGWVSNLQILYLYL